MPILNFSRPRQWADLLRRYQLYVDGEFVGYLDPQGELQVEVPVGCHEVVARIDWCRSQKLVVALADEVVQEVEVRARLSGWRLFIPFAPLVVVLAFPSRYLALSLGRTGHCT